MMDINGNDTMQYQLPLSQRKGGLGVRTLNITSIASRITGLNDKISHIATLFRCNQHIQVDDHNINNCFRFLFICSYW